MTIGKLSCNSICSGGEMRRTTLLACLASMHLLAADPGVSLAQEEVKSIPLTVPTQTPEVVEAAAKNIAHSIVDRKNTFATSHAQKDDPHGYFPIEADKLVVFALAAALDPQHAQSVAYIPKYIAAAETARTDKQVAASSKAPGSTSVVDKPGIPSLLGLAIDSGALAKNVTGSTLNLSTSPYAIVASLEGDTAATYQRFSGFTRIGIAAAFNIQNQQDPLASVQRKNLSELSVKARLFGDHSPRSPEAQRAFTDKLLPALMKKGTTLSKALAASFSTGAGGQLITSFAQETNAKIDGYLDSKSYDNSRAETDIAQIIVGAVQSDIYAQLDKFALTPAQQSQLSLFLTQYKLATDSYDEAAKAFDVFLTQLQQKPTLTLAYFQERTAGTSEYSVVKLLFEKKPKGFMQIDANGSASFYNKPDTTKNQQTFRDFTFAFGLQQNLGRSPFLASSSDQGRISLSFSGSYERLPENRHIAGKKADLGMANVKLEIPIAAGISFPISVTYANATELIKESDVRGNFGITFDLDKLRSLLTAH